MAADHFSNSSSNAASKALGIFACAAVIFTAQVFAEDQPAPTPMPTPSAAASATPAQSASPTPAPIPSPTPKLSLRETINKLDKMQVDKAVASIRETYLNSASLGDEQIQRAVLEGLIRSLAPGAQLGSELETGRAGEPFPFLAEILDANAGYARIGELSPQNLAQLDATLGKFSASGIKSLILDLRGMPMSTNYELAAEFARRFCPKGKLLFTLQKPSAKQERIFTSNQEPAFPGLIVVLIDHDTAGAPEALAAALRTDANAMIVGSQSAGSAVEFTDVSLGGGQVIRIAVAEAVLPDNSRIFPEGITPDISIAFPASLRDQIFQGSKDKGVSQFVFEVERLRMNEAALVANTNPEIESYQAAQKDRGRTPVYDRPLQRALDMVTALAIQKKASK